MDILNIVFSALNLLATVIIGVINVTWTNLEQSTILKNDKKNDRPKVSSSSGHIFS